MGDEKEASDTSFSPANTQTLRERIDFHIEELGGTPEVRAALYKIFDEVRTDSASMTLSDTLRAAYLELNAALDLGANGAPGEAPPIVCLSIPIKPWLKPSIMWPSVMMSATTRYWRLCGN